MYGVNYSHIVVNDWKFCKEHGREECLQCRCDYRLENNHTSDLYEILDTILLERDFDLDVRFAPFPHSICPKLTPADAVGAIAAHGPSCVQPRRHPGQAGVQGIQVPDTQPERLLFLL